MQNISKLVFVTFFVFVGFITCLEASPHHDDLIHQSVHIKMLELHIFRLKGLIFGLLGFTSVIIVGYLLYHFIIQHLRYRRNQDGAAFSERGLLLPISENEEQFNPYFVRPLRSLRSYMNNLWTRPSMHPTPIATTIVQENPALYRPKYANDPWENLL